MQKKQQIDIPADVIEAFLQGNEEEISIHPIGNGLINRSYHVCASNNRQLFLQRINEHVFPDPEAIQGNYIHIWEFSEFEFTGLRLPAPIYHDRSSTLYRDHKGKSWRAFEFIPNHKTIPVPGKSSQAKAVAKTFGKFTSAFEDFNISLLKEIIPGFHDLDLRFRQFENALRTERYERLSEAATLIEELRKRERYRHFYEIITQSGDFPKRVMHHDAKIGNILFHRETGRVICPVDFDTVMPGYFFSDLGDMIRSMVSSENENSINTHGMFIRKNFYREIIEGYLGQMGPVFRDNEKKYIHCSGLLMIYMQALRFLTDWLDGDHYYRVEYPKQNYDRALNQFALLEKLETFLRTEYNFGIYY